MDFRALGTPRIENLDYLLRFATERRLPHTTTHIVHTADKALNNLQRRFLFCPFMSTLTAPAPAAISQARTTKGTETFVVSADTPYQLETPGVSKQALRQHLAQSQTPTAAKPTDRNSSADSTAMSDDRSTVLQALQSQLRETLSTQQLAPDQRSTQELALQQSEYHHTEALKLLLLTQSATRLGRDDAAQELLDQSDRHFTQAATSLLSVRVEQTVAGLDIRLEHLHRRHERLTKELEELDALPEQDPRRIADLATTKRRELEEAKHIADGLTQLRGELTEALSMSQRFEERVRDITITNGHPLSAEVRAEVSANLQAALSVLSEADGALSLTAIDEGLARFEEVHALQTQRREAFAENIRALDQGIKNVRTALKTSTERGQGAGSDALRETRALESDVHQLSYTPFLSWVTGTTAAREHSRDNLLKLAEQYNRVSEVLLEDLRTLDEQRASFIKDQLEGFRLESNGLLDPAQEHFNAAYASYMGAQRMSNPDTLAALLTEPSQVWQQQNQKIRKISEAAVQSADTWEFGLKTARTVTVVTGATVATIATAGLATPALTAAGASAWSIAGVSVVTGVAGGTVGGLAVGTLSNTVEQGEAVRLGVKTREEAIHAFSDQIIQDLGTSASTAFSSSLGIASSARYLTHVTGGANKVASAFQRMKAGSLGGAVSSTSNTTIDTTRALSERNRAIASFNADPMHAHLTPDQRKLALESFLSERKLGYDQMARRGLFNIIGGTASGGASASIQVLREGTRAATGKVLTDLAEATADTSIGLATSYASNGALSVGDAIQQALQSGLIGTAIGRAQPIKASNAPHIDPAPPPPRPSTDNTQPAPGPNQHNIIYHEDFDSVRSAFVQDSVKQISEHEGRAPTAAEIRAIEDQASTMRAYRNPTSGEIHTTRIDPSASRLQRVVAASDIVHELTHRHNGDEFAAHRAQINFLEKNGYQVDLVDGTMKVSPAGPQGPKTPTDEAIRAHIEAAYVLRHDEHALQLSAGPRTLDEIGTAISEAIEALPHPDLRDKLLHLVEAGDFKEALETVQALERVEFDKLTTANFDFVNQLGVLKESLEVHPDTHRKPRPPMAVAKPEDSHLVNSQRELAKYLTLFNSSPNAKAKVALLLRDLNEVRSVEELKMLVPGEDNASSIRSYYSLDGRFHQYKSSGGDRVVWSLEIDGGNRVLIGFDRGTNKHTIVYTQSANPHKNQSEYKPEAVAAVDNYLRGSER